MRPTAGYIAWRLPKTVLDVTATFKLKSCSIKNGKPVLDVERGIAVVPRAVADDYIYGNATGDSTVRVPVSATTSFWQDRTLTVHHNANGTLSQIGAISEDQTAAIIGNVITSAGKLASIAFGVAPAGEKAPLVTPACTTVARDAKRELDHVNALLRRPDTTASMAAAYNLQLLDWQKIIDKQTITVTQTVDPGREPSVSVIDFTGRIARILPTGEQIEAAKWLSGANGEEQLAILGDLQIDLYLDFENASPDVITRCPPVAPLPAGVTPPPPGCTRHATLIDRDTQFREPAMIRLIARLTSSPQGGELPLTVSGAKSAPPIPFAQFGIPRALPIKAGIFQKLTWTYNFNEFGEQQDVSFGSAAAGVKATSLLQGASTGAASLASEQRASDARVSPETARLQAEAVALKAQIDAATYNDQVATLRAQGKIPQ